MVAADSVHAAAFAVNAAAPPPHAATIARSTTEEVSQSVIHSVGASKQALRVKATILIWQKKNLKSDNYVRRKKIEMIGGESPKSDIQNMATLWNPFSEGFEPYKISDTAGKIYLLVSYSFSNFVIDMQMQFLSLIIIVFFEKFQNCYSTWVRRNWKNAS